MYMKTRNFTHAYVTTLVSRYVTIHIFLCFELRDLGRDWLRAFSLSSKKKRSLLRTLASISPVSVPKVHLDPIFSTFHTLSVSERLAGVGTFAAPWS